MPPKRVIPRLESLESRIVPTTVLSLTGTKSFTFTDPTTGVRDTATISGTAGQATFASDLSLVTISGASADFQLQFTSLGSGVFHVGLIDATGQTIRGVTASGPADFVLGQYRGNDFSAGGGLSVGEIASEVLLENLSKGTAIHTSGALGAAITIGGNLQGQIIAGGLWSGDLLVGGDVSAGGGLVAGGQFTGTVEIGGDYRGSASIAERAYGQWQVVGSIDAGAVLQVGQDFNQLYVYGNVGGSVSAGTSIWMQIGGSILATANLSARGQLATLVGGSDFGKESGANVFVQAAENIAPSAQIHASNSITADYGVSIYRQAILSAPHVSKNYMPKFESGTVLGSLPCTITSPGTYRLSSDLMCDIASASPAITILASNVVLNLEGFSIINVFGSKTLSTGICANNMANVTIINGTISGFLYGIRAEGGSRYTVENMQLRNNWYVGMSIIGNRSVVVDNSVLNTGGANYSTAFTIPIGMAVEGNGIECENNIISGFTLTSFTVETVGIHTDFEPNAAIENNFIGMAAPFVGGWAIWVNSTEGNDVSNPDVSHNVTVNFNYGIGFAASAGIFQFNTFIGGSTAAITAEIGATNGGGNILL